MANVRGQWLHLYTERFKGGEGASPKDLVRLNNVMKLYVIHLLFTYRPYLLILRAILQLGSFSILAKIRSYMYKLYR